MWIAMMNINWPYLKFNCSPSMLCWQRFLEILRNKFKCIFFNVLFMFFVDNSSRFVSLFFWPRGLLPCKSWSLRLELLRILLVKYVGSLLGGETPGNPEKNKTHSDRARRNGIYLWRKYMRKCQFWKFRMIFHVALRCAIVCSWSHGVLSSSFDVWSWGDAKIPGLYCIKI